MLIDGVLNFAGTLIDKIFPDADEAAKAKLKLLELEQQGQLKELVAKADIVKTEAASEHTITATWRPILMLSLTGIIVNNYIIAPYLQAIFGWSVNLQFPDQLWQLLNIGVGGYVVGRSVEKSVKSWKGTTGT